MKYFIKGEMEVKYSSWGNNFVHSLPFQEIISFEFDTFEELQKGVFDLYFRKYTKSISKVGEYLRGEDNSEVKKTPDDFISYGSMLKISYIAVI